MATQEMKYYAPTKLDRFVASDNVPEVKGMEYFVLNRETLSDTVILELAMTYDVYIRS